MRLLIDEALDRCGYSKDWCWLWNNILNELQLSGI